MGEEDLEVQKYISKSKLIESMEHELTALREEVKRYREALEKAFYFFQDMLKRQDGTYDADLFWTASALVSSALSEGWSE